MADIYNVAEDAYEAVGLGYVHNSAADALCGATQPYHIGARFTGIVAAQGQVVTSAIWRLYLDAAVGTNLTVTAYAEDVDNSGTIATAGRGPSTWSKTAASTAFAANPASGAYYEVDVTTAFQTLLNRAGWVSGNAASLTAFGSGADASFRNAEPDENAGTNQMQLVLALATAGTDTMDVDRAQPRGRRRGQSRGRAYAAFQRLGNLFVPDRRVLVPVGIQLAGAR